MLISIIKGELLARLSDPGRCVLSLDASQYYLSDVPVFLLFKQPRSFDQQTFVNSTTSVANFNISQFAIETGLGSPLGGTFILVGPDPLAA